MGTYTQDTRALYLATPLSNDVLLIESFSCTEQISSLYSVQVEASAEAAEAAQVTPDALIGQRAWVRVWMDQNRQYRYFHGIINRLTFVGATDDFHTFHLELAPFVWRLSRGSNCRIFQGKTVPEIVEEVLGEYSVVFQNKTIKEHRPWDYCVQYRESDWNFLCRLMEQEGIFYYFIHGDENEKETLVFADDKSVHEPCPVFAELIHRRVPEEHDDRETVVTDWTNSYELRPGLFTMRDHNFQKPENLFEVSEPTAAPLGGAEKLEVYDYPGEYGQLFVNPDARLGEIQPEGQAAVKRRIQAEEAEIRWMAGRSTTRTLAAGFRFTLSEHSVGSQNGDYLLTNVQHRGVQTPGYQSDSGDVVGEPYQNAFTAIPHATPFVPKRRTPKPTVQGLQTALVVGPPGEEIHLDKYGRIKVQFYWDRLGEVNDKSSAWLRVARAWAGNGWGTIFHPRIGQEVLVGFLEGDPDQPLAVGCVTNPSAMPPYELPDNSTISTIKSYSSKGGGGYNELRFEDKKGSEHIYVHAEKDYHTRVKNQIFTRVGNDSHHYVGKDHFLEVKGDSHRDVGGDEQVGITGTLLMKADMDSHLHGGMNVGIEGGMDVHVKGGKNVVIEAGVGITLKAGGNFITINPAGVQIQGTMIMLNSGGAALPGAGIKKAKPVKPQEPLSADPGQAPQRLQQGPPVPTRQYSPQAAALRNAAQSGAPFCDH